MCGIAGVVGPHAGRYADAVHKMMVAMLHRGPDGGDMYVSPTGRCVLGHRRLAILDLSEAAEQPMLDPTRRWAFVYNGECYNYLSLREKHKEDLEGLHSSGDTEVLMRLLQRYGEEILPQINGMFAFALWDEQTGQLLLARDRFGQKPLYVAQTEGCLVFSSEVRAILASGLISRNIDPMGLSSYLALGSVQEPSTLLRDVSMFPAHSALRWTPQQSITARSYWWPGREKRTISPFELRETFFQSVERHLISDVPLGVFLSGGVDSTAIAAAATQRHNGKIHTLSVVFPEQTSMSESQAAQQIAAQFGTHHQEIALTGGRMLDSLEAALLAMDQPTADGINTYVVSEAAKQAGFKVALSGLGGDELFGGYRAAKRIQAFDVLQKATRFVPSFLENALFLMEPFSARMGKLDQLFHNRPSFLSSCLAQRRLFSFQQIQQIAPSLRADQMIDGLSRQRYQELEELFVGRNTEDRILLYEANVYMGQTLLRDTDAMGMAHSLEIRVPFLDTAFSDLCLALEPQARQDRPHPKWRFLQALQGVLPEDLAKRPKMGFTLPFHHWMQNELKTTIAETLRALPSLCPLFQEKPLLQLWETFLRSPERVRWSRPWSLFALGRYLAEHRLEV